MHQVDKICMRHSLADAVLQIAVNESAKDSLKDCATQNSSQMLVVRPKLVKKLQWNFHHAHVVTQRRMVVHDSFRKVCEFSMH